MRQNLLDYSLHCVLLVLHTIDLGNNFDLFLLLCCADEEKVSLGLVGNKNLDFYAIP